VITEKDLVKIRQKDPALDVARCVGILARLNGKDPVYIRKDIQHHKPLRAPGDFSCYRDWTPLPRDIAEVRGFHRFILVVKNIAFLGWYENGRLAGDTYVGIGKKNDWTKAGFYKVDRKDPVHWSTYPDAYGDQAVMPDALHIYARVWIHLGDVVGPHCSHGCINVPSGYAGKLWDWADVGAPVLVTESLKTLHRDLEAALRKARVRKKSHSKKPVVVRHKAGKAPAKKQMKTRGTATKQ
jgi:ribosomal protein S21